MDGGWENKERTQKALRRVLQVFTEAASRNAQLYLQGGVKGSLPNRFIMIGRFVEKTTHPRISCSADWLLGGEDFWTLAEGNARIRSGAQAGPA